MPGLRAAVSAPSGRRRACAGSFHVFLGFLGFLGFLVFLVFLVTLLPVLRGGLASSAWSATLTVATGDSLPDAVGTASAGDTVRVAAGRFAGPVELAAGVTLIGDGPGRTIIEAEGGIVVTFAEGARGARLQSLRVAGGTVGIQVRGGAPSIVDCWIVECKFYGLDLGEGSQGEMRRVLFRDNSIGVLARSGARSRLRGCVFRRNTHAVKIQNAFPILDGCTVTGNEVGILVQGIGRPRIGGSPATANRVYANRRANLRNETRQAVPARYNFWGDVACDFRDDFEGEVDFLPFLDSDLADSTHSCD